MDELYKLLHDVAYQNQELLKKEKLLKEYRQRELERH